ncbi:protein MHF2 homolog isoform X2 [Rhododendron vialii]|uniref:protein MHF2 homolog isoform X2 n=1 Tax=Rhododendron vialii TaxID=182163 RepID=UPI00266011BB|nr:protein MHF2 homolog isoform X2 [Rhododendron vialii]XP_058193872.1 protein MHF2 homolog isoform X2 [Rhododendron vialii]
MDANTFDPDLIHAIFKLVWNRRALQRGKNEGAEALEGEPGAGTSKKSRPTFEAVERAATIAEAEGASTIEATHLERVLPQLLLDF